MSGSRPKVAVLLCAALAGGVLLAAYVGGNQPGSRGPEARTTDPGRQVTDPPSGASGRSQAGDGGAKALAQSGSTSANAESGQDAAVSSSPANGSGGSSSTLSQSSNDGVSDFAGTGRATVSFHIRKSSRLRWTSAGERFSAKGSGVFVDSRHAIGEVDLAPGDYRDVALDGGAWTVVVEPR